MPIFDNNAANQPSSVFTVARPGIVQHVQPTNRFDEEGVIRCVDVEDAARGVASEVVKLSQVCKAETQTTQFLETLDVVEKDIPNRDTEIIALGTGSAVPSKYRNVSATLIRVPGYGSYLLDCGENTLGGIRRHFGYTGADEVLKDLRAIWISHLHADHHLGTASVIRAWHDVTASDESTKDLRLAVFAHEHMCDWISEYGEVEDLGLDRLDLIRVGKDGKSNGKIREPVILTPEQTARWGLSRVDATLVNHCHGAMAVVLAWPSGLRIAYSGDCRPSEEFAEIGRDATLLIHESTFDDELGGEARAKKHSTMSEALNVARKMNARRVLLTHFSQRYPKIGAFNSKEHAVGGDGTDRVALLAFDHMRVKLGDFRTAAAYLPALQKLVNGAMAAGDD